MSEVIKYRCKCGHRKVEHGVYRSDIHCNICSCTIPWPEEFEGDTADPISYLMRSE